MFPVVMGITDSEKNNESQGEHRLIRNFPRQVIEKTAADNVRAVKIISNIKVKPICIARND